MADKHSGIIDPPIDELLSKVDSKYQLVIFASKRARQINDYYADLHEGTLFDNVGPLVDSTIDDKPLSVALHEINEDKLVLKPARRVVLARVARRATLEHRRRHHRRHRRVQGGRCRARTRARAGTTCTSSRPRPRCASSVRPTLEAISRNPVHTELTRASPRCATSRSASAPT